MRLLPRSLRSRLVCATLVILAIPMVSTAILVVDLLAEQIQAEQEKTLASHVATASLIYENQLEELKSLAQGISLDNTAKMTLHLGVQAQLAEYLSRHRLEHRLSILTMTDANGVVFGRGTNSQHSGDDLSADPTVREALAGNTVASTEVVPAQTLAQEYGGNGGWAADGGDVLMARVARPIYLRGELIGSVVVGVVLNGNALLLGKMQARCGDADIVVTRNGYSIASTTADDNLIGSIADAVWRGQTREAVPTAFQFVAAGEGEDDYHGASFLLKNHAGERVGAISVIANMRSARAAVDVTRDRMLAISVALALVAVVATLIFSNSMVRPIKRVVGAMEDFGRGQWHGDLPVRSTDEVDQLAAGFNDMAGKLTLRTHQLEESRKKLSLKAEELRKAHNELELRVAQRTTELAEANSELKKEISERNRAEEALRETHDKLLNIIEFLPDPTFVIDTDKRVVAWNKAMVEMTGVSKAQIIGRRDYAKAMIGEDRPVIVDLLDAADSAAESAYDSIERFGSVVCGETFVPALGNGKGAYVWAMASPLLDADGNVVGAIESVRDITERKRAERELKEAKDAAESSNRTKSEFLANMSHEIRTPMTAILGFSEQLTDPSTTEEERLDAAMTIRRNGQYLLQIINDILDLSKIEAGKLDVERLSCSPIELVDEVCDLMQVRAEAGGLTLKREYEGLLPERIETDPTRLKQILINLVGNAIKFTEEGEVRVSMHMLDEQVDDTSGTKERFMEFAVADTGIGIGAEKVIGLFEPFSQVDSSTTRRFGGTGLGLAVSQRLAIVLGGEIQVESEVGKGSVFRVKVGVGSCRNVRMVAVGDEVRERVEPVAEAKVVSTLEPGCRVLLVEDGPDNQRLISFILDKAGAQVVVAENGQIALDEVSNASRSETAFDVILMDMQMPVMDGYQATRTLRQNGYQGAIVALTAHAMESDHDRCLSAGCDDYATKPIDRSKLLGLIDKYYRLARNTSKHSAGC